MFFLVSFGFVFFKYQNPKPFIDRTLENVLKTDNSVVDDRSWDDVDISNWKTYHNEEYGFELKYPNDYSIGFDIHGLYSYKRKYSLFNFLIYNSKIEPSLPVSAQKNVYEYDGFEFSINPKEYENDISDEIKNSITLWTDSIGSPPVEYYVENNNERIIIYQLLSTKYLRYIAYFSNKKYIVVVSSSSLYPINTLRKILSTFVFFDV